IITKPVETLESRVCLSGGAEGGFAVFMETSVTVPVAPHFARGAFVAHADQIPATSTTFTNSSSTPAASADCDGNPYSPSSIVPKKMGVLSCVKADASTNDQQSTTRSEDDGGVRDFHRGLRDERVREMTAVIVVNGQVVDVEQFNFNQPWQVRAGRVDT